MNTSISAKKTLTVDDEQVADFLQQNPDFFTRRPDLLCDLTLPHQRGQTVSLVERQVALLRERNIDMRRRLAELLENANANNELFENTRQLVLDLMEAASLTELTEALQRSLEHDFKTDFQCLCLLTEQQEELPPTVRCASHEQAQAAIGNLLTAHQLVCGVLRDEELVFLFGAEAAAVGSAAVIPLLAEHHIGVLAVGSKDPLHFKSGMGTLFLNYIAEMLNRTVPQYLPSD
ncbi:MAG: DUF484 family protein [Pseudomonadales bacterium]